MNPFKFILLLYITHLNHLLNSQTISEDLIVFKKNELYGFVDSNFNEVIPAKYTYVRPFAKNGLAKVMEAGLKFGFINTLGEYVIKPQFTLATSFFGDIAYIYEDDQIHINNKNGQKVKSIHKGIQEMVFVNFTEKDTILCQANSNYLWNDPLFYNKNGLIDKKGNVLIPPKYERILIDSSGNYLLESFIKYLPNNFDKESQYTLLDCKFNFVDTTIIGFNRNWHSYEDSVLTLNKQGDTIKNIAPTLKDLTWDIDKLIKYKWNYLEIESTTLNINDLISKNNIHNDYPFRDYKNLIVLKTEKIINITLEQITF